ncbi:MAG: DUF3226 domain-containing protein [Bacteroidia bacterium]|nr:DUF3226 domain-containing protein [Bacteroidia bacterium]
MELWVEGKDDEMVCKSILEKHGLSSSYVVINKGGYPNLKIGLKTQLKADFTTLGLIVDADHDPAARWQSLRDIIHKHDPAYGLPKKLPPQGFWSSHAPSIGIWIMPDNQRSGMLEDFIRDLIPQDNALLPEADASLSRIEALGIQQYVPVHRTKALIHTWLAWQEEPGMLMSSTISKHMLATASPLYQYFLAWLQRFSDPTS